MAEQYRPSLNDPNVWVPYRYHPSRVAAIVFVVAFAVTTLLHAFQMCKRGTWYFIPLVVGGICMHLRRLPFHMLIITSRGRRIHRTHPVNQ